MSDSEELESRINETKEQLERAEAHAEHSREKLEQLKRERRAAAGPSVEEFEDMSPGERRDLKEEDPETWRDLMRRKRERGEAALQSTSSGGFGS